MTNDNDKAKAFFILHDPDVVENKVMDVLTRLFSDPIDRKMSRKNAKNFLHTLLMSDADENHPIMNHVMNELFHSGRLRMGSGFGEADFIDSIRQLIRNVVREEMARTMDQIERRVDDLKRGEYNSRYNKFLR